MVKVGAQYTFDFEDFYTILSQDKGNYIDILKELSDFFNERMVKVSFNWIIYYY